MVMEAMKMENELRAKADGRVKAAWPAGDRGRKGLVVGRVGVRARCGSGVWAAKVFVDESPSLAIEVLRYPKPQTPGHKPHVTLTLPNSFASLHICH